MTWKTVGVSIEGGPFLISGLNVWEHEWRRVEPHSVQVLEPTYRKIHELACYEIVAGSLRVRFAVVEASYGAYLFAVPA